MNFDVTFPFISLFALFLLVNALGNLSRETFFYYYNQDREIIFLGERKRTYFIKFDVKTLKTRSLMSKYTF